MFIRELATADAIPALEAGVRFAAQRQRVIVQNVANLDTPDFRQRDLPVAGFREALGRAIDDRRRQWGGTRGELEWRESTSLRVGNDGEPRFLPVEGEAGVLFHDRNNRDVERLMQDIVENVGAFRVSTDLLKSRYDLLRTAIAGRI